VTAHPEGQGRLLATWGRVLVDLLGDLVRPRVRPATALAVQLRVQNDDLVPHRTTEKRFQGPGWVSNLCAARSFMVAVAGQAVPGRLADDRSGEVVVLVVPPLWSVERGDHGLVYFLGVLGGGSGSGCVWTGEGHARLVAAKAGYDPQNLLRFQHVVHG